MKLSCVFGHNFQKVNETDKKCVCCNQYSIPSETGTRFNHHEIFAWLIVSLSMIIVFGCLISYDPEVATQLRDTVSGKKDCRELVIGIGMIIAFIAMILASVKHGGKNNSDPWA